MASQESSPAGSATPSAQVVGNAFVQQFFLILHQSPELVHRFYQENSKLGRPEEKGEMSTISTLQAINEKILSLDYTDYRAQIKTVDAQKSLNGGVLVLVTGYLFGKDNVKRDFAQTFFLATQVKGYYVLNDIFRYVEEGDQEKLSFTNESDAPLSAADDIISSQEHHVPDQTAAVEEEDVSQEEVYDPSEHDEGSAVDEEEPVEEVINEVPTALPPAVVDPVPSIGQEQKMSYASIVRVMKENAAPVSVSIKVAPIDTERQAPDAISAPSTIPTAALAPAPKPAPKPAPPPAPMPTEDLPAAGSYMEENNIVQDLEADCHSIYIKNLPLNATPAQLEEAFQKFGAIKPSGIQVRSNKLQGFCFGFVEFEVPTAVQSAIEASPLLIGGRQAYVEEKRPSGSRATANNRGRFLPGRGGGFRGDGMRSRGSYGGGRPYARGDYNNRSDMGNVGGGRGGGGSGGSSGRGGDQGYQRGDHASSNPGNGSRSGSLPRAYVSVEQVKTP